MKNIEKIINSYNKIHSESEKLLELPLFYEWILDKLKVRSHMRLLDIASGSGSLVKSAQSRNIFSVGIDISKVAVEKANSKVLYPKFIVGDGEKLPFPDDSFDYVTNIGSLEHFIHPCFGLKEIRRVLRNSGRAAIFLPNSYYIGDIIFNVMLHGNGPSHNQIIDRFKTKNEWMKMIEENGLVVNKIYYYNSLFPRTKQDWIYLLKRPNKIFALLSSPLIPKNLSYSFLYICQF